MTSQARFDDALPTFAYLVSSKWGREAVESNLFLRDASGHLTFVVLDVERSKEDRRKLGEVVANGLQSYVDGAEYAIATPEELFDESLRQNPDVLVVDLVHESFSGSVRLVDRRMVGGDWLRSPGPEASPPVRFVFGSIKGGVGRSTALCVVAAELARAGKRVLAIDMDLEAPGLGSFLLSAETLPEFGILDYLVENEVGQETDDRFLTDMISASWLSGGLGRVDVLPAIGQRSMANPQNVLAKIARAYLADSTHQTRSTFQDHMANLINAFTDRTRYDLILIDARAGLHETTASALLGLGADVLLFGVDQSQTYAGYKLLFSHLRMLPAQAIYEWRNRLTIVQAKTPADSKSRTRFAQEMQEAANLCLRDVDSQSNNDTAVELRETFNVDWAESTDDPLAVLDERQSVSIISIFEDERFRGFEPTSDQSVLSGSVYSAAYKEILDLVRDRIADSIPMEAS